ncbi:hypothetical protein [Cylindrospermum sp. FACHB-282]|uniref:hypothetical protein n=1 Tax=Cylindrospermum sp. FACHB-282 TaxID=2692794 RepID=UPI001688809C|nr:hypothetical protein [Cylindrospermum sp. FACHB-282]MBD2386916.1 hypothetical protein [Cylindrospermum sp. FACHB-282]
MKKITLKQSIEIFIFSGLTFFLLSLPSQAQDIPAPSFESPPDGAIPEKQYESTNIMQCASEALIDKFPFDILGTTNSSPATDNCPRITFFENTPAGIEFEACFLLSIISVLKYPVIMSFIISAILTL